MSTKTVARGRKRQAFVGRFVFVFVFVLVFLFFVFATVLDE